MATTPPSSAESKTIFQLDPFVAIQGKNLREAAVPIQLNNENFFVLISQIVAEVKKADLGLSQVDNTSDALKPISEAVAVALRNKAASNHTHTVSSIEGMSTAITEAVAAAIPDNLVLELPGEW